MLEKQGLHVLTGVNSLKDRAENHLLKMMFKAYIPVQRKTPHNGGIAQGENFVLWNMDFKAYIPLRRKNIRVGHFCVT